MKVTIIDTGPNSISTYLVYYLLCFETSACRENVYAINRPCQTRKGKQRRQREFKINISTRKWEANMNIFTCVLYQGKSYAHKRWRDYTWGEGGGGREKKDDPLKSGADEPSGNTDLSDNVSQSWWNLMQNLALGIRTMQIKQQPLTVSCLHCPGLPSPLACSSSLSLSFSLSFSSAKKLNVRGKVLLLPG